MKVAFGSVLLIVSIAAISAQFSVSVTEEEAHTEVRAVPTFDVENPPSSIRTPGCTKGKYCFGDAADFAQQCKSNFHGFANGGRCFFRTTEKITWDQSFTTCKEQGAELAQFHTVSEFTAMTAYMREQKVAAGDWHWIALKRMDGIPTGVYSIDPPYTWWYDSPTSHHPHLNAANTYVRRHERNDGFQGAGVGCMVIWGYHDIVGDWVCSNPRPALCVRNNADQTFAYIGGVCLSDIEIERHHDISVEDCAGLCSKAQWCRSFNYYPEGKCDLFSIVLGDTYNKENKKKCFHYSYRQ